MISLIKRHRQHKIARKFNAPAALMEAVESRQLLSGGLTAKLVAVPISSAALTADPALANFKSYDLQVTVTGTDHWSAGELIIKLKTGSFYLPSGAQNTPAQGLWSVKPNLEFHNFVSGPGFSDPGLVVSPVPGQQPTISSTLFSIDWGVIGSMNSGTFTIARITLQNGSTGVLAGKTGDTNSPGVLPAFSSVVPFTGTGASIAGYVWNDVNSDGKRNLGETNIPNVQLYVDLNANGHLDPGEKSVRSRSNGNYTITGLAGGNYRVRVNNPAGFRRTAPSNKSFWSVGLIEGAAAGGKRFGFSNRLLITGTVFNDPNKNKIQDSGEAGLKGFTVFADKDLDGVLDSNETSTLSSANGGFSFTNLSAGTYIIRILGKKGFKLTTPSGFAITLPSGGSRTGLTFGERKVV